MRLAAIVEMIVEGRLNELLGRRRMEQSIAALSGHVIICGWGRVGRAIAADVHAAKRPYVVVDIDPERLAGEANDVVVGDATEDAVLEAAGIDRRRQRSSPPSTATPPTRSSSSAPEPCAPTCSSSPAPAARTARRSSCGRAPTAS